MPDLLAVVSAIYTAFGQGNVPGILEHLADEVQWEVWADNSAQRAGVPWLQPRHGKEEALEFFKIIGGFNMKEFQVLSLMVGKNQVAVEFVIEVEVPSTGGHYRDEEIHLWTFNENGQVTRLRHYTDTAKHIAAAKV